MSSPSYLLNRGIPLQVAPLARVPLVKLQPQKDGPTVDVCIGRKESVRNSRLLGAYMNLDPRARYVEQPNPSGFLGLGMKRTIPTL